MSEMFRVVLDLSSLAEDKKEERLYLAVVDLSKMKLIIEFKQWIKFLFSLECSIELVYQDAVLHNLDDLRILLLFDVVEVKPIRECPSLNAKTNIVNVGVDKINNVPEVSAFACEDGACNSSPKPAQCKKDATNPVEYKTVSDAANPSIKNGKTEENSFNKDGAECGSNAQVQYAPKAFATETSKEKLPNHELVREEVKLAKLKTSNGMAENFKLGTLMQQRYYGWYANCGKTPAKEISRGVVNTQCSWKNSRDNVNIPGGNFHEEFNRNPVQVSNIDNSFGPSGRFNMQGTAGVLNDEGSQPVNGALENHGGNFTDKTDDTDPTIKSKSGKKTNYSVVEILEMLAEAAGSRAKTLPGNIPDSKDEAKKKKKNIKKKLKMLKKKAAAKEANWRYQQNNGKYFTESKQSGEFNANGRRIYWNQNGKAHGTNYFWNHNQQQGNRFLIGDKKEGESKYQHNPSSQDGEKIDNNCTQKTENKENTQLNTAAPGPSNQPVPGKKKKNYNKNKKAAAGKEDGNVTKANDNVEPDSNPIQNSENKENVQLNTAPPSSSNQPDPGKKKKYKKDKKAAAGKEDGNVTKANDNIKPDSNPIQNSENKENVQLNTAPPSSSNQPDPGKKKKYKNEKAAAGKENGNITKANDNIEPECKPIQNTENKENAQLNTAAPGSSNQPNPGKKKKKYKKNKKAAAGKENGNVTKANDNGELYSKLSQYEENLKYFEINTGKPGASVKGNLNEKESEMNKKLSKGVDNVESPRQNHPVITESETVDNVAKQENIRDAGSNRKATLNVKLKPDTSVFGCSQLRRKQEDNKKVPYYQRFLMSEALSNGTSELGTQVGCFKTKLEGKRDEPVNQDRFNSGKGGLSASPRPSTLKENLDAAIVKRTKHGNVHNDRSKKTGLALPEESTHSKVNGFSFGKFAPSVNRFSGKLFSSSKDANSDVSKNSGGKKNRVIALPKHSVQSAMTKKSGKPPVKGLSKVGVPSDKTDAQNLPLTGLELGKRSQGPLWARIANAMKIPDVSPSTIFIILTGIIIWASR